MLKRLYKRFLEWALAPVMEEVAAGQMATASCLAGLQVEVACIAQAVESVQAEAESIGLRITGIEGGIAS